MAEQTQEAKPPTTDYYSVSNIYAICMTFCKRMLGCQYTNVLKFLTFSF